LASLLLVPAHATAQTASTRPLSSTPPLSSTQPLSMRVSMFGDSVLLGAQEELLAQFTGHQATVDAAEDRSLLGAISTFQSAGPALGDVVVLDLGYNDASDPAVFRTRIDGAMAALAGVREVIWLNQHDWGPGRAGMNAELAAAPARYSNLTVIDWNAEVAAHPDYVYADQIHLTPAGQNGMATVVRQQFDRWVESLTPTTTSSTTSTSTSTTSTTRPSRTAASGEAAAPVVADDDSGVDGTVLLLAAGVLVVVVAVVIAFSVRRRAARRAGRGTRRGR
jgi:hypothetical protein